ncbi:MAG: VCBS repeat-containing protein [Anaerolineae bacterium]|nr:VCBS repeat-containing protein [Phycisphaerae bacterium]
MKLRASLAAIVLAATSVGFGGTIFTGTDEGTQAHVKAFTTPSLATETSFFAYPSFTGGVRVAASDLTGDGLADIVTGAGPGAGPHVKVFDRTNLSEVRSFFAYGPGFNGGVYVAAGDLTGDRRADIFTGAGSTSSHVKVFDGATNSEVRSFFAFPAFGGGVRVAAGDVNGDGRADIIAGTAPGAAELRVFDAVTGAAIRDFLPYGSFTGGIYVASGDVNNDGLADLITSTDDTGGTASSQVKVFDGATNELIQSFMPFAGFTGSVRVAAGDLDGDGRAEIITGTALGGAQVKAFDGVSGLLVNSFIAYPGFTGGIFVAGDTPVPEPGAALALALSTVCLVARRRRFSARSSSR